MKRLYVMMCAIATALTAVSCDFDDDGVNFNYTTLRTVDAELPDSFDFGRVYTVNVDLLRPDDCTLAEVETFDVRQTSTDSTNIRTIAAIGIVLDNEECAEVEQEFQDSFQFEVRYTDPYVFRFYTGDDANGDPEFLEIEVPVNHNQ
ncbi:MAG: hypothetical protein WA913_01020 [Pricia sp.]